METSSLITRRQFLHSSLLAAAVASAAAGSETMAAAVAGKPPRFKILVFTKPFDRLNFEETADLISEVGFDGIECAVRAKAGHIAPARVEEDLPKMVAALAKRGKEIGVVTTEILKVDPTTEKVLRTMAKLGLKKYRLGFAYYTKEKSPEATLAELAAGLKDLVALNKELGLQGGYQNHSGANYVGAPVWDIWTLVKEFSPEQLGICFDIGHATIEGGLSWPIQARLVEPHLVAVYCKDFRWEQTPEKGWQPRWCPFGEGAVRKSFVENLKKSAFAGPLCQHHEYPELAKGVALKNDLQRDLAVLRGWLGEA